ncbi:MAG: tetratricopeptide repeat protein [Armatimonadetes bacterium]|nr:tetratricopeptide repeat protein [Armatimonadota bacterium]
MHRRREKLSTVAGVVALIVLVGLLQVSLRSTSYDRLVLGLNRPMPITKVVDFDPTAITGVVIGAILGGFREVAATMLWLKVDELWDSGRGTEFATLNLMRTVTLLDPHWIEPWRITAWHLAYNLYVETEDPHERAILLDKAVACLKEGISWNPDIYDLYFELGWTYFDKIKDYEEATKWLEACTQFEHPEYIERLIAHAYERLPEIDKALDWYDYCIKRNPGDHTAIGATTTIRERYLRAWRLAQQKRYDEALKELEYYLMVDPEDLIGLHFKADLYERMGQKRKAHDIWKMAGEMRALDDYARYRASLLAAELGLPAPPQPRALMETKKELAVPVPK